MPAHSQVLRHLPWVTAASQRLVDLLHKDQPWSWHAGVLSGLETSEIRECTPALL